ncbi:MAG: helix-turn-helix domain-containing protein [Bdellovibrionaceae bacterium]|nr:helix-turn-helix domain-containing protein [Pseudobdellovibrionaceae bacterium]
MNTKFNHYDILELSPQCSQNDITDAYNKAKATYSGQNPALYTIFSEQEAREYLRLVEEAYAVLGNRSLRALYDEKLVKGVVDTSKVAYDNLLQESRTNKSHQLPKIQRFKLEYEANPTFEEEIKIQSNWSGDFLKKVREYKKVSLEQLAEITKITPFYLNALEKMERENLPAPVFVRGYLVQVCRTLNLDDKKVADSYMRVFKGAGEKA